MAKTKPEVLVALKKHWAYCARSNQIAPGLDFGQPDSRAKVDPETGAVTLPNAPWAAWVVLAGRGFGKTRCGGEWTRQKVKAGYGRGALIAPTAADVRDVLIEGESGILNCCAQDDVDHNGNLIGVPKYEPSKRRLTWANGAIATCYSAEDPESLRGPQHDFAWADELAAWSYLQETWDQLQFGLRIGDHPQACVTTTPKPLPLIRSLIKDPNNVITRGSTYDNRANLAPSFFNQIIKRFEGTRLGQQELMAAVLEDFAGAFWTQAMLEAARKNAAGDMLDATLCTPGIDFWQRIIVAVDPSGTKGQSDEGDWIGIIVVGLGRDGIAYVLSDKSIKAGPLEWGMEAVKAYHTWKADRIVAERNFGGAMVEAVIRTADSMVSYKEVTASRGKTVRAEPVAALYEQGKVKHLGHNLAELEAQMAALTGAGYMGDGSPDRVDALVWAITELCLDGSSYDTSLRWV